MSSNILSKLKRVAGAAAACALITGITTFMATPMAYASALPAPGTDYTSLGEAKLRTLPGAEGSQLGIYDLNSGMGHPHETYYPFMDLKFSPGMLTIYYAGLSPNNNTCQSANGPTAGCVEEVVGGGYSAEVEINIPGQLEVQYLYLPPSNFESASPGTVQTYTIPLTEAAGGYENVTNFSIQYMWEYLLESSGNSTTLRCNPDTFNSIMKPTLMDANGKTVGTDISANNTNYFNIDSNGDVYEVTPKDEELAFKNGAHIDFYPAAGIFNVQRGSKSTDDDVKMLSSSGEVSSTLPLNDTSYDNPFAQGDKIEIDATPSNPITSETSLPPSGSGGSATALSGSDLSSKGWNLTGDNTVINRYSSANLLWQPSSSDLPAYRYMLFKYLGQDNFNTLGIQYPAFFKWLWDSPEALNEFLTSGYASQGALAVQYAYLWEGDGGVGITQSENPDAELRALEIWGKIWREYPDSESGEDLKIAVAVSLDFASNVISWLPGKPIDPVGRYEFYAQAYADNTLVKNFSDYSAQMLRDVVDNTASNAGLEWLHSYIVGHDLLYLQIPSYTYAGYTLIRYTPFSPYGGTVFGGNFFGPDATIWNEMRYAGVCGNNAKFSVIFLNALGGAGYAAGQSGFQDGNQYEDSHCSYIYFYDGSWHQNFATSGWGNVQFNESGLLLTFIGTQLNADQYTKNQSYLLTFKAEFDMAQGKNAAALSNLKQAVAMAPANVVSWQEYVQAANQMKETSGLKKQIQNAFNTLYASAPYTLYGNQWPFNTTPPDGYNPIVNSLTGEIKS